MKYYTQYIRTEKRSGAKLVRQFRESRADAGRLNKEDAEKCIAYWNETDRNWSYSLGEDDDAGTVVFLPGMNPTATHIETTKAALEKVSPVVPLDPEWGAWLDPKPVPVNQGSSQDPSTTNVKFNVVPPHADSVG